MKPLYLIPSAYSFSVLAISTLTILQVVRFGQTVDTLAGSKAWEIIVRAR